MVMLFVGMPAGPDKHPQAPSVPKMIVFAGIPSDLIVRTYMSAWTGN